MINVFFLFFSVYIFGIRTVNSKICIHEFWNNTNMHKFKTAMEKNHLFSLKKRFKNGLFLDNFFALSYSFNLKIKFNSLYLFYIELNHNQYKLSWNDNISCKQAIEILPLLINRLPRHPPLFTAIKAQHNLCQGLITTAVNWHRRKNRQSQRL